MVKAHIGSLRKLIQDKSQNRKRYKEICRNRILRDAATAIEGIVILGFTFKRYTDLQFYAKSINMTKTEAVESLACAGVRSRRKYKVYYE